MTAIQIKRIVKKIEAYRIGLLYNKNSYQAICLLEKNRGVVYNPTMYHRGLAQLASAPRLGRGGRRFESSIPDQIKSTR